LTALPVRSTNGRDSRLDRQDHCARVNRAGKEAVFVVKGCGIVIERVHENAADPDFAGNIDNAQNRVF
jgi:hypothetical protein